MSLWATSHLADSKSFASMGNSSLRSRGGGRRLVTGKGSLLLWRADSNHRTGLPE